MIKIEHVVLPSPEQLLFTLEGMRNPKNSWDKSDSRYSSSMVYTDIIGESDYKLMKILANAGTDHRKFMRQLPVAVRITAPLYWWKEFDTYKVGTVANSCSTMHKIQEKAFTRDDFSCEQLFGQTIFTEPDDNAVFSTEISEGFDFTWTSTDVLDLTIMALNHYRDIYLKTNDKKYWWQLIQLLPSSYNQTRNVTLNYEVLANMYRSRKNHKLNEWIEFCKWISELPWAGIIIESPQSTEQKRSSAALASCYAKMVHYDVVGEDKKCCGMLDDATESYLKARCKTCPHLKLTDAI